MLQGERFASGVIITNCPSGKGSTQRAVLDYKKALAKYFPARRRYYVSLLKAIYATAKNIDRGLTEAASDPSWKPIIVESMLWNLDRNSTSGLGTILNVEFHLRTSSISQSTGTQLDKSGRFNAI